MFLESVGNIDTCTSRLDVKVVTWIIWNAISAVRTPLAFCANSNGSVRNLDATCAGWDKGIVVVMIEIDVREGWFRMSVDTRA